MVKRKKTAKFKRKKEHTLYPLFLVTKKKGLGGWRRRKEEGDEDFCYIKKKKFFLFRQNSRQLTSKKNQTMNQFLLPKMLFLLPF